MTRYYKIHAGGLGKIFGSVLLIVAMSEAPAQDRLSTGADITFRASYSHDSNLFLTNEPESDKFSTYGVNFGAIVGYPNAMLTLRGDISDNDYDRFSSQDDTSYDLNVNAALGSRPLQANLFGQYLHSIAPLDTTNLMRAERDVLQGWASFEAIPFYLFGINYTGYWEDGSYVGYDEYEYLSTGSSVSIFGMYDKYTEVGLRYYRGLHNYDDLTRYDVIFTRMTVYVDYDHKDDLVANAELGYETLDFEKPRIALEDIETAESLYAMASMRYIPNDIWEVGGKVQRSLHLSYSQDSNFNTKTRTEVSVVYRPASCVRAELSLQHTYTDEDATFDSDTYGAEMKLTYALAEWAEVGMEYEYDERRSYVTDSNYERHLVSLGLALRW